MSSSLTKTQGTSLIAWQDIATANVVIGGAVDVSTVFAATVLVWMTRNPSAGAFTAGWPNIRIEISAKSSGDDAWIPVAVFQPGLGTNLANTTLNGAIIATATSCVVHNATYIAAGDVLFLGHTTIPANYEVMRVKSVAGTTINFESGCDNAHDDNAVVTDQAEIYNVQVDLTAVGRIRAVVDNIGSGRTISVQVLMVTGDSIG